MLALRALLTLAVLACAVAQDTTASKTSTGVKKPGMPGINPMVKSQSTSLMALGRMREALMGWYCVKPEGTDTPPCKTHQFIKKLKATKDAAEKSKILKDRQAAAKAQTAEERVKTSKEAKAAYSKMYSQYCMVPEHKATEVSPPRSRIRARRMRTWPRSTPMEAPRATHSLRASRTGLHGQHAAQHVRRQSKDGGACVRTR